MDANSHAPRPEGPLQGRGLVRLDSLRHFGRLRHSSSFEDASDRTARDLLQGPVAHYCRVSSLGKGCVVGFASGKHRLAVLVGYIAYRCGAVGLCVCELHLQTKRGE